MSGGNEKVLQAVVLADSFNERFMPITLDRPRCLLPLVNIPIIEYTFEFLAISGVQEVILFCRAHADQIRQYITHSRWAKATSTMHIQIVVNGECMSMGDALRDIDARSLIHGDFILVCGDVVSNMNLTAALQAHKARRAVDKNYILTMVLKETSPFHRSRERCEGGVFAIDAATHECLAYEPVESENVADITLSSNRLSTAGGGLGSLSVRFDLLDCQIDICSVNVLALYTENFDYQDVRKDFLRGVLTSDILGVRVATHILRSEYASRVRSPHLYDSISKDIIERWVFPVVPEADPLETQPYSYRKENRYIGPDVVLSRSAQLGRNVVLGSGVSVGEGSVIRNSVIGAHCRIGADVVLDNVYLWECTVVESGCCISHSIIADHVRVRTGSTIARGCLITSNITLGPKADLPPRTRIAKLGEHIDVAFRQLSFDTPHSSDDTSDGETEEDPVHEAASRIFLGEGSDGVVWEGNIDEAVGGLDSAGGLSGSSLGDLHETILQAERQIAYEMGTDIVNVRPLFKEVESEVDLEEEEEEEEDDEGGDFDDSHGEVDDDSLLVHGSKRDAGRDGDELGGSPAGLRSSMRKALGGSGSASASSKFGRNSAKFLHDALDLMTHAIASNYLLDNAMLELNGLKFSCNASFSECRLVILRALYSFISTADLKGIDRLFETWAPLLARFTQGVEEQIDLIDAVQMVGGMQPGLDRTFSRVIPLLYKTDVLDEEAILEWYERRLGEGAPAVRQISKFVEWLREASDEESEDEEEEEEEAEEEEEEEIDDDGEDDADDHENAHG